MSRIYRRRRAGSPADWTLEVVRDELGWPLSGSSWYVAAPVRCLLSFSVTTEEARRLGGLLAGWQPCDAGYVYRGYPTLSYTAAGRVRVKNIEVTEPEARRIAGGADPFEVLLGEFPACGYRLVAVTDPLLAGG